jgi:predicted MFS family arabinose efflux permease
MRHPSVPATAEERGAWRLLLALAALNTLSFVDRQLVVTLAPLLMADLNLTRAQIGLLVGASFIVVFALLSLVLGAAADRLPRPRLIAGGLALWSATTALTAAAQSFGQMALLRVVLGVGEAVLAPAALSMLKDRFPPARLGLAGSVFYAGVPIGFAISFGLAAWIGPRLGWRACFLLLGLAGLAAVVGAATLRDPPRREGRPSSDPPPPRTAVRELRLALAARPSLGAVILGAAALAFMSAASQHTITWLVQERGLPYPRAALLSGAMVALAGLVGNVGIGAFTDFWRRRGRGGRPEGLALLGAAVMPCAVAFYLLPPSAPGFLPCWFVAQAFMLGWFGPAAAEILERAPDGRSATVMGFGLLALNLLGVSVGPWVTGVMGDRVGLTAGLLASLGVGALGLGLFAAVAVAERRPSRPTA